MRDLIRNWKIRRKLLKHFGLRYIPSLTQGTICFNRFTNEVVYLKAPLIPTAKGMLVFYHELGHYTSERGMDSNPLVSEMAAWIEAFQIMFKQGIIPNLLDYRTAYNAYLTYASIYHDINTIFKIMSSFSDVMKTVLVEGLTRIKVKENED
jgi:hypothetical protein